MWDKSWRPQHYSGTVMMERTLKRPSHRVLMVPSCSRTGHGSRHCGLLVCPVVPRVLPLGRIRAQSRGKAELALSCRVRSNPPSGVGRGRVLLLAIGRGEAWPRTSGEARPALSPRTRQRLALSRQARQSRPPAVGRGGAGPRASGEAEPNSRRLGKKRSSALVRPGVFNVQWLLVPPPWVPRY